MVKIARPRLGNLSASPKYFAILKKAGKNTFDPKVLRFVAFSIFSFRADNDNEQINFVQTLSRDIEIALIALKHSTLTNTGLEAIDVARGPRRQNFWHTLSFCAFERQHPKQNNVARLKSKYYTPTVLGWLRHCSRSHH